MQKITPDMELVIKQFADIKSARKSNNVSIFTGRITVTTWCSLLGDKAVCISNNDDVVDSIPDDHIIIAVSKDTGLSTRDFRVRSDGLSVDGCLGHDNANFRVVSLEQMYGEGKTFFRIPELALRIGCDEEQVNDGQITEVHSELLDISENLIASILLPVVEDKLDSMTYYINIMGKTHPLKTRTTTEVNLPVGLYDYRGVHEATRIGSVEDHVYVDRDSLRKDILLFHNKKEAESFATSESYYNSLDSSAKALATERERILNAAKSTTNQLDNEVKVTTIKAKGKYETSSLSRKDSQERSSHGRNMLIASMAACTAGLGALMKFGFSASIVDLVIASSVSVIPLLAGLFIAGTYAYKLPQFLQTAGIFIKDVMSTLSEVVTSGVTLLVRGIGNFVCGVASFITAPLRWLF